MNDAAERLFDILDSNNDGFITKDDVAQLCQKLELDEGAEAFILQLGFQDDPDRSISIDDIFRCGIFDSVGQNDVSHNLAVAARNDYESIFDLLLVLQKVTTTYLRHKHVEVDSELQQTLAEKDNLKQQMEILIQEYEEREKSVSDYVAREKLLRQEINSLYDQLDECKTRDRTNTNETNRSRIGSEKDSRGNGEVKVSNDKTAPNSITEEHDNSCDNCSRLMDEIRNLESIIEQLNSEKKKMSVKVHAADTYLTQVRELESAYRNLEQHTMQMSSHRDQVLAEYEELKGNHTELKQRYEELKNKIALGGAANVSFGDNLDTASFSTHNTTGGFSFADELAYESREQVDALEKENILLMEKIKALEDTVRSVKKGGVFSPRHTINDLIEEEEEEERLGDISLNDVNPLVNHDNEESSSLPDSGLARSSPFESQGDGICGHVLIGTASLFLHCLRHDIGVSYSPPIVERNGQTFGHLKVKLQRIGNTNKNAGSKSNESPIMCDLLLGSTVTVHIGVIEATGIPPRLNNYVFCQYKFWDNKDVILPALEFQHNLPRSNTSVFEHQETYSVTVTESFLNYINDGLLSIEVWGLKMDDEILSDMSRTGSIITTNANAPLYDRWSEMMTRLQLWVEILEINDSGIYSAVEVQQRSDLRTGGVYQLRQGLSRRILVRVLPVGASGNIACKNISYISIGNVHSQTRHQPALDSYQNEDLLKLRCAWSEALENVQNKIGEKLHKLTEKDTLTDEEEEERGKLLEEWIRLLRERDAVLLPKDNSGVPGAKDSRAVPAGMESRIPTLFVDVQEQLRQNSKQKIVIGESSNLNGQDPAQMFKLTSVKHDQHRVCAIAAWDSSTHESEKLNCLTEPEQRVYLTLQVGVDVSLPYGMELELVLRKRLCVRIYKRKSLRDSMRGFMQDIPRRCGVMYEVVTGIPLFSNYSNDNLYKRTSTPVKEELVKEQENEAVKEELVKEQENEEVNGEGENSEFTQSTLALQTSETTTAENSTSLTD